MSSPDLLYVVKIKVAPRLVETIDTALDLIDVSVSRWESADGSELRFDIFFDSNRDAEQLETILREQLTQFAEQGSWDTSIEEIQNKKWQDSWKEYFHVERISEHIVIKPSHEEYTPEPADCVINIDPGMSFGTGQHATTKGCLQFLDKLISNDVALAVPGQSFDVALAVPGQSCELKRAQKQTASFLDLGCGSGILSIAAAKLGYAPITAIDIDPDSIVIAAENFAANKVENSVDVFAADVSELELPQTYTVVTANILATVLLANAEKIAANVSRPHGYLLLAGILTEQYPHVCDVYSKLGFEEIDQTTEKEWTSGCFKTV